MAIYKDDVISVTTDSKGSFILQAQEGLSDMDVMRHLGKNQPEIIDAMQSQINGVLANAIEVGKQSGHEINPHNILQMARVQIQSMQQEAGTASSPQAMVDVFALSAFEKSAESIQQQGVDAILATVQQQQAQDALVSTTDGAKIIERAAGGVEQWNQQQAAKAQAGEVADAPDYSADPIAQVGQSEILKRMQAESGTSPDVVAEAIAQAGGPDVVMPVDPIDNDAAIVAGIQSNAQAAENEAIASEPETAPLTITISGGRVERAVIMGHGKGVEQKNEAVERMQDLASQIDSAYKEQLTYTNRQGQKVAVDGREGERTRAVAIDVGAKIGLSEDDLRQMPISEFNARLEQHLIALQQKQEADVQIAAAEITEPASAATTEVAATADTAPATVAPATVDPRQAAFDTQIEQADLALAAMGDRARTPDNPEQQVTETAVTVASPAMTEATTDANGVTIMPERMAIVALSPTDVMPYDVNVQTTQTVLKSMGYEIGEANGRQDVETNKAFEEFAQNHKINLQSMTMEDFRDYAMAAHENRAPSSTMVASAPDMSGAFLHTSAQVITHGETVSTPAEEHRAHPLDNYERVMADVNQMENDFDSNAPGLKDSFNQLAKGIMFWRDVPENEAVAEQSQNRTEPTSDTNAAPLPVAPPPGSQWT